MTISVAGTAGAVVTCPLEVVKTRLQSSRGVGGPNARPSPIRVTPSAAQVRHFCTRAPCPQVLSSCFSESSLSLLRVNGACHAIVYLLFAAVWLWDIIVFHCHAIILNYRVCCVCMCVYLCADVGQLLNGNKCRLFSFQVSNMGRGDMRPRVSLIQCIR